ncbi:hypothetical protein [Paraburkholderia sacchari]|nr:hypothetical protein [Paraburkholderia sacchari]
MKSVISIASLGLAAVAGVHFVIAPVFLQIQHVLAAVSAAFGG